jgi:hypothetical protein
MKPFSTFCGRDRAGFFFRRASDPDMISSKMKVKQSTLICSLMNNPRFSFKALTITTLAGLLSSNTLYAHPGHSLLDATPTHLLTSPNHFIVLAVSGVLLWFGARLVKRQLPRRILQGAGILALAVAVVTWSMLA